jgi:hypothetical protein
LGRRASALRGHDGRVTGPLPGGERAQHQAQRGAHTEVRAFAQRRMRCPRTRGDRSRTRRAGCPEGDWPGCPFSWLLLFGQAKRSDSGRPKGGSKALASALDRKQRTTKPSGREQARSYKHQSATLRCTPRPSPGAAAPPSPGGRGKASAAAFVGSLMPRRATSGDERQAQHPARVDAPRTSMTTRFTRPVPALDSGARRLRRVEWTRRPHLNPEFDQ